MYKEYYYFVAGLPALNPEDAKMLMTPVMFVGAAKDNLSVQDYSLLQLMLLPNDLANLVSILLNKETWLDESAISQENWLELIAYLKEIGDAVLSNQVTGKWDVPQFIIHYLHSYLLQDESRAEHFLLKDLFTLLYQKVSVHEDRFIRDWFSFDADLRNIMIALNCRKHNISIAEQLIGENDVTEKLSKSNTSDFGLSKEYPFFDVLSRLNEQNDIIEKEKGLDALKWKWIDNETFFDYFTIPRILGYFQKLRIIYRWIHLSPSVGEKRFGQVLHELETSFEFPEDFALNKR